MSLGARAAWARIAAALVLVAALATTASPTAAAERPRWDTRLLALVPAPGFPAHAYVHPNGRIYAGTYVNPSGDSVPSRVFEYTAEGTLRRSWTLSGQDLSAPHGIQVATSDARGRLLLLDRTPARALLLDPRSGEVRRYATFANLPGSAPPVPNFAAWGSDGALYVTDYLQGVVWRVAPGGGAAEVWLDDPRLHGGEFGTTGIELAADRRTLLIAQQIVGGELLTGGMFAVEIGAGGEPGEVRRIWTSGPLDLADGLAIARSGRIYVALVGPNQIAVLGPDGAALERFPELPISGENGSPVPFDGLSSVGFRDTSLITASQSFLAGEPSRQALHDVETGEPGIRELIPRNAGLVDPELSRVSLSPRRFARTDGTRIRFTLSEDARVRFRVERRRRAGAHHLVGRFARPGLAGRNSVRFFGRVVARGRSRPLPPGRYRLRLRARDSEGDRSRPVRLGFVIRGAGAGGETDSGPPDA